MPGVRTCCLNASTESEAVWAVATMRGWLRRDHFTNRESLSRGRGNFLLVADNDQAFPTLNAEDLAVLGAIGTRRAVVVGRLSSRTTWTTTTNIGHTAPWANTLHPDRVLPSLEIPQSPPHDETGSAGSSTNTNPPPQPEGPTD
jgi:hypothetical protein